MADTKTRSRRSSRSRAASGAGRARAAKDRTAAPRATEAAKHHVCDVAFCPIGLALTGVQQAAPEALDHLLVAARELFLAATAVLDARAADFGTTSKGGLERIEIA